MLIKKVFCYSKDVAKKNGNKLPIIQFILSFVIFIIVMYILSETINIKIISIIAILLYFLLIIYYVIITMLRMYTRMSAYAIDSEGKVYKVFTVGNGLGLYYGGIVAGSLIDKASNNNSNSGKSIGEVVGTTLLFYSMNKSAQLMSQSENVEKFIKEASNIKGIEVLEILKVYSSVEKKHFVRIKCDYKFLKTNIIKNKKNIKIEKSFDSYDELINIINTLK